MRNLRISPTRIWTPLLNSQKTCEICTLCHMIPWHQERNHQATANSPTVLGALGWLMSPLGTRLNTVWAGKFQWKRKLDSNFKLQLCQDSTHSLTGVIRWCGCFQVCLKIQRMMLWWKGMVQMHCIPLWRVGCMLSGQGTKEIKRIWHTGSYKLESLGQSGGGRNRNWPIEHQLLWYHKIMHTSLISSGLRQSKHNWRLLLRDTLYGVFQQRGGSIARGQYVPGLCWETPRFAMTFLDIGRMNDHSIFGYIRQFSDARARHYCPYLSTNLGCILNLTITTNQERCTFPYKTEWKCTQWCTSSASGSAILTSSWPRSTFEAVSNEVCCASCGHFPHVCRNRQWLMHRNAAHIPTLTKSLHIHNDTQSGRDWPNSHICTPCSDNSEIVWIE